MSIPITFLTYYLEAEKKNIAARMAVTPGFRLLPSSLDELKARRLLTPSLKSKLSGRELSLQELHPACSCRKMKGAAGKILT
jgi:hypothetical protein